MKIRAGFVSNSSSSSFIVASKQYNVSEETRKASFNEVINNITYDEELFNELQKRYDNGEFITWLNLPYDCFYDNPSFEETYTQFGVEIISRYD